MYNNQVESLRETGDCRKNLQQNLGNVTAEHDYFKKVQHYQDLNKDLQHRPKNDMAQKLNVVNEVLATE